MNSFVAIGIGLCILIVFCIIVSVPGKILINYFFKKKKEYEKDGH